MVVIAAIVSPFMFSDVKAGTKRAFDERTAHLSFYNVFYQSWNKLYTGTFYEL